jgi:toxin secretion/phage lysis holin
MIEHMESIFERLTEYSLGFKGFIYGLFVFLDMDVDVVKILAILMGIDTFLGMVKAIRLNKKISFNVLLLGMISKLSILILPMILALIAKALHFDFTWFVSAVLNILVLSEGISAITNILSIRQKKEIKNEDFITKLLYAIRSAYGTLIDRAFKAINPEDKENE